MGKPVGSSAGESDPRKRGGSRVRVPPDGAYLILQTRAHNRVHPSSVYKCIGRARKLYLGKPQVPRSRDTNQIASEEVV